MPTANTASPRALPPLLAGIAALLLSAAPAAEAAAPVERVAEPASSVRDYWTPQRMRAAVPVGAPDAEVDSTGEAGDRPLLGGAPSYVPSAAAGSPARAAIRNGSAGGGRVPGVLSDEVADPSAVDLRAHGRVFFTIPQGTEAGDYVCSATAVNSRNRSVVWTAGHCVFEISGGGYVTNWTFVPAYSDRTAPFGEWPAKRLAAPKPWQTVQNLHYDLGAAVVGKNTSGQRLQEVVGARGIGFDLPRDQLYDAYGYPAELPFTGEREYQCESEQAGSDQTVGSGPATMSIDCDMTGGASGGGWISGTTLLSVTSYGYRADPFHLYGPYMSRAAKALYRSVSGKRKRKHHGHGGKGGKGGGKGSQG